MTSEVVDVQFDPLQGGDYVSEAVVAGGRRVSALGQGVQGEEAEQAAAKLTVTKTTLWFLARAENVF